MAERPAMTERDGRIDAIRFVCFCLVVVLHLVSSATLVEFEPSIAIDVVTRVAVPVFFMITGYLMAERPHPARQVIVSYARRLGLAFLFWVGVYYLIDRLILPLDQRDHSGWHSYEEMGDLLLSGGIAYHLWFLPALFLSVTLFRLALDRFGLRLALLFAAGLFVIGLIIGPYSVDSGAIHVVGQVLSHPANFTARNGPLFGAAFVALGYLIARRDPLARVGTPALLALLVAGLAIQILEVLHVMAVAASAGFVRGSATDVSIGTVLSALAAFSLLMRFFGRYPSATLAELGRSALGMYCVHVLFVIAFTKYITPSLSFSGLGLVVRLAEAVVVIVLSVAVVQLMRRIPALTRVIS